MKRMHRLIALLALCLTVGMGAQAQGLKFGLSAGMNFNKLHFSGNRTDMTNQAVHSSNRAGWYIGPKLTLSTGLGLGADAAIEYTERYLDINGETETYRTFEVPVNVRYGIGLGSLAKIYATTGPQFGFAIGHMSWSNLGTGTNFSKRHMNTTWNVGAGLTLLSRFDVSVGYNIAFGSIGKASRHDGNDDYQLKYKTNSFRVSVAYLF